VHPTGLRIHHSRQLVGIGALEFRELAGFEQQRLASKALAERWDSHDGEVGHGTRH
jgi:hypothetical protein